MLIVTVFLENNFFSNFAHKLLGTYCFWPIWDILSDQTEHFQMDFFRRVGGPVHAFWVFECLCHTELFRLQALAWCPWNQQLLASGGGTNDRHIRFWNVHTGACLNAVDTDSQVIVPILTSRVSCLEIKMTSSYYLLKHSCRRLSHRAICLALGPTLALPGIDRLSQ